MINELAIGLLLSSHDMPYLKGWIARHDGIGLHIIIGLDDMQVEDIPNYVYNCQSRVNIISTPLMNNFAQARNKIIDKSKELGCLCTLFLDADELLLPNSNKSVDIKCLVDSILTNNIDYYAFIRYNIFSRHLVDFPNYHPCFVKNTTEYVNYSPHYNASPGCHEQPKGNCAWLYTYQILHLKENWTSNFRGKGYHDVRQEAALEDLNNKINNLNI